MATRTVSRWLMSIALAVFSLVTINLLLASTSAQAHTPAAPDNQIRYVATTGSDVSNDCAVSGLPCATAQHAVDVATDGDEVRIVAGTYSDLSVRPRADVTTTGVVTQIVYLSKTLTLRGGYTTTNWLVSNPEKNPTVLDAQAQGRVIYVTGSISPTIEGLRLTNGNPLDMGYDAGCLPGQCLNVGGAVFAITATMALNDNQISNNSAGAYEGGAIFLKNATARLSHNTVMSTAGSGISLLGSSAVVSANVIVSNTSSNGGGLLLKFSTATVNNNQILSNTATYACGGGVCMSNSIVTLTGNIIRNNRTEGYFANGAGVSIYFSAATLKSNVIEHNIDSSASALGGGGIFLTASDTTLIGNIIQGNISSQVGGGISMVQGPNTAVLVNNVIAENQAETAGGGLYIAGSSARLIHNTIARNASGDGSGIYAGDFYYGPPYSTVALTNTIIFSQPVGLRATGGSTVTMDSVLWQATPITIAQTATATVAIENEIYGDARFVDPVNGDYHLRLGSAAIDQGIDAGLYTDLDGNPRPFGAGFDVGAYEFSGQTRYVATTGLDISNDCLNSSLPCATIQHAIDVANDGEQVLIAGGLYTQSATLYKPVSLTGVSSDTTILHAVAGQRVLTVTGPTIDNSVVISGLTFTGGYVFNGWQCPDDCGGGISLINSARPTIQRVIISDNVGVYGGGLYSDNALSVIQGEFVGNEGILYGGGAFSADAASVSDTLFENNRCGTKGCLGGGLTVGVATSITGQTVITNSSFTNNIADNGAAAFSFRSTTVTVGRFTGNFCGSFLCGAGALVVAGSLSDGVTLNVSGSQFRGNSASNNGSGIAGAIYFTGIGAGRISNSLFVQNRAAEQGAAIVLNWGSNTTILNSTFSDVALNPYPAVAVYAGSTLHVTDTIIASYTLGILNKAASITEDYNLFFNAVTNTISVTSGGHSLIGDAKFVDPLNGNYHLQFGSAAIDRGVDAGVYTDLDGNIRPHGTGFDIGAYEYQGSYYNLRLPLIRK